MYKTAVYTRANGDM